MERLTTFSRSIKGNSVYFSSLDPESIIQFLRGRDYCIEEMEAFEELQDGSWNYYKLILPDEEPEWIRSNHAINLDHLMESFEKHKVYFMRIKLSNDGFINQDYGEFIIKMGHGEDLKTPTLKVLEMYGIFAGEKIWELAGNHFAFLAVSWFLGYENEEITEDELNSFIENIDYSDD